MSLSGVRSGSVKAVIFDLDGTLIDSMGVWQRIDVEFLAKRGLAVPPSYAADICALSFRETAEYTIRRFNLRESPEALLDEWNAMAAHEYSCNVPLKPYAREYIAALRDMGVKLAVATSLSPPLCELVLKHNGIFDCFDSICFTDDVGRGKEFPDIFLHAASALGVSPENCLVFEDIAPAVKSAKEAGMSVIGVLDDSAKRQWGEISRVADGVLCDFKAAVLSLSPSGSSSTC
jgi:HAD superfamily hydrolase (TIGR01509 family)